MKKKHLQHIIILVFFICLGLTGYFLSNNTKNSAVESDVENNIDPNQTELEEMIKSSRKIIEEVESEESKKFRGIDTTDHILGVPVKGKVEIIFYGNFEDSLSIKYYKTLENLIEKYKDQIIFSFRYFYFESEPTTVSSLISAECAAEQGKFWEMYKGLFSYKSELIGREKYLSIAKNVDLDLDKFENCFKSGSSRGQVINQKKEADEFYILGMPVLFVNNEKVVGNMPMDDFVDSTGDKREGLINIVKRHMDY